MIEATKEELESRENKIKQEAEQKKLDQEQLDAAKKGSEGSDKTPDETEDPEDKIDRANAAATRLEAANKKKEDLLIQEEKLQVNNALGGKSELTDKPTEADKQKEKSKALLPEGMECPGVTD